jgi:hypothetical protein
MRQVTEQEYRDFIRDHKEVVIDGNHVKFIDSSQVKLFEPTDFVLEKTTVWSFENRGKWATHRGNYRANWAPEIPRNLILAYTEPADFTSERMVGVRTISVQCKPPKRNATGIAIR